MTIKHWSLLGSRNRWPLCGTVSFVLADYKIEVTCKKCLASRWFR